MKKIIAIQGYKNSGKDEVAKMLQYLLSTPKFMHNFKIYNLTSNFIWFPKFKIVKYANTMKKMLSILLNVDVDYFEDRNFKENTYVDFSTLKLIKPTDHNSNKHKIMSDSKFIKELRKGFVDVEENYLSVRQLLQYFGTEVMRNNFGSNIWILSTMRNSNDNIIISDQRFINENEIANSNNATIVHVIRNNDDVPTHSSENEVKVLYEEKKYDILIHNNNGLKELFYLCKTKIKIK